MLFILSKIWIDEKKNIYSLKSWILLNEHNKSSLRHCIQDHTSFYWLLGTPLFLVHQLSVLIIPDDNNEVPICVGVWFCCSSLAVVLIVLYWHLLYKWLLLGEIISLSES